MLEKILNYAIWACVVFVLVVWTVSMRFTYNERKEMEEHCQETKLFVAGSLALIDFRKRIYDCSNSTVEIK